MQKCMQRTTEHMCVGKSGSEAGRFVVRVEKGGPGLYQDHSTQAA